MSWRQLFYSFLIFVSFNGIAMFLFVFQEKILEIFGVSFEMNSYPLGETFFCMVVLVLAAGVVIPIGEELFYRGMIVRGIEKIDFRIAVIISAWFFAINHDNPYRLTTLFLFGILIGMGRGAMDEQYGNIDGMVENSLWRYILVIIILCVSVYVCKISFKKLREISGKEKFISKISFNYEEKFGYRMVLASITVATVMFIINNFIL